MENNEIQIWVKPELIIEEIENTENLVDFLMGS